MARSLGLADLGRYVQQTKYWWMSLQYGDISQDLADVGTVFVDPTIDPITSMDDAAAQIAGLDLVVSVANTTVHLAGSLVVPTLALLPKVADRRWTATRGTCLWYPSVKLVRQTETGDWTTAIDEILEDLSELDRSY